MSHFLHMRWNKIMLRLEWMRVSVDAKYVTLLVAASSSHLLLMWVRKPPTQSTAYILRLLLVTHLWRERFFFFFYGLMSLLWAPATSCCADSPGCRRKNPGEVMICGWSLICVCISFPLLVFCCGTFLSNYDPIVGSCVLWAPPRPKPRQVRHRMEERRRKWGEFPFRVRVT